MRLSVVVLGTGGTIAGVADTPDDELAYRAGVLSVNELVAHYSVAEVAGLETEQVAQVDSKDMSFTVWQLLAGRVAHHLAREDVGGIVVTHGTDTLEETAYFLQRVLAPQKPVVLTAAMRPATAHAADGPQNLRDAILVARHAGCAGVAVVMAGTVHSAHAVRKAHTGRLDAFTSGDDGPLARFDGRRLQRLRDWPSETGFGLGVLPADTAKWPLVEIVVSHAGAGGAVVEALCANGTRGLVAAATGNGTLHAELEAALLAAQARGVAVVKASRWLDGRIVDATDAWAPRLASAGDLSPVKARIELMLRLMREGAA